MCRMWAAPNSIFSMWEDSSDLSGEATALCGFLSASLPGVSLALGVLRKKAQFLFKEKLSLHFLRKTGHI